MLKYSHLTHPIKRARGLGSAHKGLHHWWMQRVTALTLIPLAFWLVFSLVQLLRLDNSGLEAWFASPFNVLLMLGFVWAAFTHARLGLQVVIEDYVHRECAKTAMVLLNNALFIVAGVAAAVAVIKLHFSGVAVAL